MSSTILNDALKQALLKLAQEKAGNRVVTACGVYGSQVAGYAKPDSDFDLLVAAEDFHPKVRYIYAPGPPTASLLVADTHALKRDAEKAALGEFVAGRLLNPYIAIKGAEFLEEVEYILKKRVVMEILKDLVGEMGPIATEFLIPTEFFLLEKLRLRMAIYPPVTYSYVKTYTGPEGKENLRQVLRVFNRIMEELIGEGILERLNGFYRLTRSLGGNHVLSRVLRDAYRGVTQYAVHGYAGRVSWKIVAWEAASKLNRGREVGEIPQFLSHPRSLLRMPEGTALFTEKWEEEILATLSLSNPRVIKKKKASRTSTREFWVVESNEGRTHIAVKKYGDIWSLKWALVGLWAFPGKRFSLSPSVRMAREYRAIRFLRQIEVDTPKVVAVVIPSRVMATEVVNGVNFEREVEKFLIQGKGGQSISGFARLMAKIHSFGWAIGDTKPENVLIIDGGRFMLVDLEQAEEQGDPAWDIAEFIYYSLRFIQNPEAARRLAYTFASSYIQSSSQENLWMAMKGRYLTAFQPIVTKDVVQAVRDAFEEVVDKRA